MSFDPISYAMSKPKIIDLSKDRYAMVSNGEATSTMCTIGEAILAAPPNRMTKCTLYSKDSQLHDEIVKAENKRFKLDMQGTTVYLEQTSYFFIPMPSEQSMQQTGFSLNGYFNNLYVSYKITLQTLRQGDGSMVVLLFAEPTVIGVTSA